MGELKKLLGAIFKSSPQGSTSLARWTGPPEFYPNDFPESAPAREKPNSNSLSKANKLHLASRLVFWALNRNHGFSREGVLEALLGLSKCACVHRICHEFLHCSDEPVVCSTNVVAVPLVSLTTTARLMTSGVQLRHERGALRAAGGNAHTPHAAAGRQRHGNGAAASPSAPPPAEQPGVLSILLHSSRVVELQTARTSFACLHSHQG